MTGRPGSAAPKSWAVPGGGCVVTLDRFGAPGNLTDLDEPLAAAWSDFISDRLDNEVAALVQEHPGLQPQFYNATKLDVTATPAPISWPAFPNIVEINFGDEPRRMFEEAESRDNQDEYLEWVATRENGTITRVTFTCEGPERRSRPRHGPDRADRLLRVWGQGAPQRSPHR